MKLSLTSLKRIGGSVLILSSLGGCYMERDVDVTPSLKAKAHLISKEHFIPLNTHLTARDRRLLNQYKNQLTSLKPIYAEVTLSGSSAQKEKASTQKFLEPIISFLVKIGIPKERISVMHNSSKNVPEGMWVRLEQFTVLVPPCPGFDNYVMDGRIPPEGEVTFGCATEANFAAMIAEPRDLHRGRDSGFIDPHQASQAIERLRTDKTKELKIEKIENSGG